MLKKAGFFAAAASVSALALAACGDSGDQAMSDAAPMEDGPEIPAPAGPDGMGAEPDMDMAEAIPDAAPPPAVDVDEPYDPAADYGEPSARADFEFAEDGAGTAWFFETPEDGLRVYVLVRGAAPGAHAMHVHETGDCSAADFTSAGGHLGADAGEILPDRPADFEAGNLPDIAIEENGEGMLNAVLEVVTISEAGDGQWALLDDDGASVVIHENATGEGPEDNPRIACAEIYESDL